MAQQPPFGYPAQFHTQTAQNVGQFYGTVGVPQSGAPVAGAAASVPSPAPSGPIVALVVAKNHEKESLEAVLKSARVSAKVRPEFTQFDVMEFVIGRATVLVACMRDQGPVEMAAFTTAFLLHTKADYVFTIGILGVPKPKADSDPNLHEVLLAQTIYAYGRGRTTPEDESGKVEIKLDDFRQLHTDKQYVEDFAKQWRKDMAVKHIKLHADFATTQIVCGTLVRNDDLITPLNQKYNVSIKGVEMESWGIWRAVEACNNLPGAHTVHVLPICKGVSDIIGPDASDHKRQEARDQASFNSALVALRFLEYRFRQQ